MSRLPFELLIALRYLRPKRTFVSVITVISVLGVTLGVAVLIIVISVMSGFDRDLRETVLGVNAHLKVTQREATMPDYTGVAAIIRSNRNVVGVAPYIVGQVLVETQPPEGQSLVAAPVFRGMHLEGETNVSILPKSLIDGTFDLSGQGLVVGSDFAKGLKVSVGDRLAVYSPRELRKMREHRGKDDETAILPEDYEVRGIFNVGYFEFDNLFILVSLETAQELYDLEDTVHGLMVKLEDPFRAHLVADQLRDALGYDFVVTTWMEDSPMMMAVLVEKNVMLYILFFIVIVAAFGITCTLITFIVMKTREIGLLKAIGASNNQVMSVFLLQSMTVSILGVACGLGLGLLAISYRNEFLSLMRRWTGWQLFPADIYGFSQLPALLVPTDIAIICGGSLVICLLAAALPSRHASNMNTVEALRHE
jgi:lipoprotein-releasing system permease protein